jgi:hypothetical protein
MEKLELIIFLGGGVVYVLNEVRKWAVDKKITEKKGRHKIEEGVKLDSQIYALLWHILSRENASRVYITQFHNGELFYTGQSIQRQTISHEITAQGHGIVVETVKPNHSNVLISQNLHTILVALIRYGVYQISDTGKVINNEDRQWLEIYNVKSLLYIKINDKNNRLIAVLNIHWDEKESISSHEIAYLIEYKKRFETIFNQLS